MNSEDIVDGGPDFEDIDADMGLNVQEKPKKQSPYLFKGTVWKELMANGMKTAVLTKSHRQVDKDFVELLDRLRVGEYDAHVHKILAPHVGKKINHNGIESTRLCSFRSSANAFNLSKLNSLQTGKTNFYPSYDTVFGDAVPKNEEEKSNYYRQLKPSSLGFSKPIKAFF
ncbi:hypothetical protein BC829DRAFT_184923 [Chytridium lagenaria]|nr:hypothetical protein BC829DRAFT_184923 [Chytridium lagenaria]